MCTHPVRCSGDIAVIELKKPLTFTATVGPICLDPNVSMDLSNATVVGFGKNGTRLKDIPDTMQMTNVEIIREEECTKHFGVGSIRDDEFCAKGLNGSRVCRGDSGGSLVVQNIEEETGENLWYLKGLVSRGDPDCTIEKPDVYVNVTQHLPWIKDTIYRSKVTRKGDPFHMYISAGLD